VTAATNVAFSGLGAANPSGTYVVHSAGNNRGVNVVVPPAGNNRGVNVVVPPSGRPRIQ
jgi:hypothetical protein